MAMILSHLMGYFQETTVHGFRFGLKKMSLYRLVLNMVARRKLFIGMWQREGPPLRGSFGF